MTLRIATWNVNSLRMRLPHLVRFLREADVDVCCLQELKLTTDQFPTEALVEAGYPHLHVHGQATYNGVAIVSRRPLEDRATGFVGVDDPEARIVSAVVAGVRVYGLYTPNGQAVGHPKFLHKLRWLEKLRAELDRFAADTPVLVCGDMNVAPDDVDVWDPFRCEGTLLFHPDERAALANVRDWGLVDAYRAKHPFKSEFSWWDYQKMGFQRGHGLRIDHVYLSAPLMSRCTAVVIHKNVRGWDQPSDHAPVSVDLTE